MRFEFLSLRRIVLTAAVVVASLGIGGTAAVNLLSSPNIQKNDAYNEDNVTQLLDKPTDGTKPSDHTILENIQIAAGVLNDNPHFKGISTGHALTNMVITNDQNVYTERRVDGKYAMVNTVTASNFVKTAFQKFTTGYNAKKVFIRNGNVNLDDLSQSTFSDEVDPTVYTRSGFLEVYGWLPYQLASYVFAEDSVSKDSVVLESDEYDYVAEVHMNLLDEDGNYNPNSTAFTNSKREVKTNGGAISYPTYNEITVTVCLNNNWQVQRMIYHDVYNITVQMGVPLTAPVDSNITEDFYYDQGEYEIDQSIIDYYAKYADADASEEEKKEKGAMDYLSESMLGMALAGSTLDIETSLDGEKALNGKVFTKFNIKTSELKLAALFDEFYLKYDKELYISYRKYNYKLDEAYFSHLIEALNIDVNELMNSLQSGGEGQDSPLPDGLMSQLSNLTLTKGDNGKVNVSGTLDYEGVYLSFLLDMNEDEDGAILNEIQINASYQGKIVKAKIKVTSSKIVFEDKEYVDLSSSSWFIDEMINIVSFKGYQDDISFNYKDYNVDIKTLVDKNNNAKVNAKITYSGKEDINFELYYFDKNVYFSLGNIALELTSEDSEDIVSLISSYINSQDSSKDIKFSSEDLNQVLETIYEVFEGVSAEEGRINITLCLSKLYEGLQDTVLSMHQEDDILCFDAEEYNFKMRLYEYVDEVIFDDEKSYLNREDSKVVVSYYNNIANIIQSDSYSISLENVTFKQNDLNVSLDGIVCINQDEIYLSLKANYQEDFFLNVYYHKDEGYYISYSSLGNLINIKASEKELLTLIDELEKQYYALDARYDFNKLLSDYLNLEKDNITKAITSQDKDIDNILPLIYDIFVYVQNSSLKVVNNELVCEGPTSNNKVRIYNESDHYGISLTDFNYQDYHLQGQIGLGKNTMIPSINKDRYVNVNEVIVSLGEFTKELNDNNLTFKEIFDEANVVTSFKGYEFNLVTSYEDYSLNATFYYDKDGNAYGKVIALDSLNNKIKLDVIYKDSLLYILYGNMAFEATNENINEIAYLINQFINVNNKQDVSSNEGDTLINGTKLNLQEIIDQVFKVYQGIEIENDDVNISFALSSLNKDLNNITCKMYKANDVYYLSESQYHLLMSLKEFEGKVDVDSTLSYLNKEDVNNTYNMVLELGNALIKDKLSLSFNDIKVKTGNTLLNVNGTFYKENDNYRVNLVLSGDLDSTFGFYKVDDMYYLIISYEGKEIELSGSYLVFKKMINDVYDSRYGLIEEETLNELYAKYIKGYLDSSSPDVDTIIPYVFKTLYALQEANLTLEENQISFSLDSLNINVIKNEDEFNFVGNVNYVDIETSFNIELSNREDVITIPAREYFNMDYIIDDVDASLVSFARSQYTIEDLVNLIQELSSYSSYLVSCKYEYLSYETSLDIEISKNLKSVALRLTFNDGQELINVDIFYENGDVYVSFGNINIKMTNDDLSSLSEFVYSYLKAKDVISSNKTDKEMIYSYINKAFDIYDSITFRQDGKIDVKLLLSSLGYHDEIITLGMNDNHELFVLVEEEKIELTLKNIENISSHDESLTYLTRVEYEEFSRDLNKANAMIKDLNNLNININNLMISNEEVNGCINGQISSLNGNYYLDLNVSGTYEGKIKLGYVDEIYYLDLLYQGYEVKLKLTKNELLVLVDTLIANKEELFGNEDVEGYLNVYLKPIVSRILKDQSLEDTLKQVYAVVLKIQNDGYLTYSNHVLSFKCDENYLEYTTLDEELSLIIYEENLSSYKASGNILINNKPSSYVVEGEYYSLGLLVKKLSVVVDEFAKSNLTINDLYTDVNHIVDYNAYEIKMEYTYQDYEIYGKVFLTKDLDVDAQLYFKKPGQDSLYLNIKYLDEVMYVTYYGLSFKVTKDNFDEVMGLVNQYLGQEGPSLDLYQVLDEALNALSSFKIDENNHILIGVSLTSLIKMDDFTLDFVYLKEEDVLSLSVEEYNFSAHLMEFNGSFGLGEESYLDRDDLEELITIIRQTKDIISQDEFVIYLNDVEIIYQGTSYKINGTLSKNKELIEANVSIALNNKLYQFILRRIEKAYYLDLTLNGETYYLSLQEEDLVKLFIDIYEGRAGLINDENLNKLEKNYIQKYTDVYDAFKKGDYSLLSNDQFDLVSTFSEVYDVLSYLTKVNVKVSKGQAQYLDDNNDLIISSNNGISLIGNLSFEDIKVKGNIVLKNNLVAINKTKDQNYIALDNLISHLSSLTLSLRDSSLTVEDLIKDGKDLMSFKGYDFNLNFGYENYRININAYVVSEKSFKGELTLSKDNDEDIYLEIYGQGQNYFLIYQNIALKVSLNDLEDTISLLSSYIELSTDYHFDNEELNKVLTKTMDVLLELKFDKEGNLKIGLALSRVSALKDVTLSVSYDQINHMLKVLGDQYGFNFTVKEYLNSVEVPGLSYLDRVDFDSLVSLIKSSKDIALGDQVVLYFDEVNITLDNTKYQVNGSLIKNGELYEANFNILVNNKSFVISLRRIEKDYYLDLTLFNKEINLVLSEEQIIKLFIDIYEGRAGLLNDEDFNKLEKEYIQKYTKIYEHVKIGDYSDFSSKMDVIEMLNAIYDSLTYLKNASISHNENKFIYKDLDNEIILYQNEGTVSEFNLDLKSCLVEGKITLKQEEKIIKNKEGETYVNIDSLITRIDELSLSLISSSLTLNDIILEGNKVLSYVGYNVNLNFVYEDYRVNLVGYLDKLNNIYGEITISSEGHQDLELMVYVMKDNYFIQYENINLKLTKDDLLDGLDLISKYMSFTLDNDISSSQIEELISKGIDVLSGLKLDENNHLVIGLALNELGFSKDMTLSLSYDQINEEILLSGSLYSLNAVIKENKFSVNEPSGTFLTREEFSLLVDDLTKAYETLKNKNYVLSFDNVNVTYDHTTYLISGQLKQNESSYELDLTISFNDKTYRFDLRRIEKLYYLDLYFKDQEFNFTLSEEQIVKLFLDIYNGRKGLLNDENFNKLEKEYIQKYTSLYEELKEGNYSSLNKAPLSNTLQNVYKVMEYLISARVEVKDEVITYQDLNNKVSLSSLNGTNVIFNINQNGIKATGNLILEDKVTIISNKEGVTYVNINELVSLVDELTLSLVSSPLTVEEILDDVNCVIDFKGYNLVLDFEYLAYHVQININITSLDKMEGEIIISSTNKKDLVIDLTYYEDNYYLSYGNISLHATSLDIKDLLKVLSKYITLTSDYSSSKIQNVLDKTLDVINKLQFNDNKELEIGLSLSKISGLKDLNVSLSYDSINKNVLLVGNEYELSLKVSEYLGEIIVPSKTYLEREEFDKVVSLYEKSKDLVLNDNIYGEISSLVVTYNEKDYLISGTLIKDHEDYKADLNITFDNKVINLILKRIEKQYYLDITYKNKTYYIKVDEKELVKLFIDIYEGRAGLLNEEDLSSLEENYLHKFENIYNNLKNGDYSSLGKDADLEKTLLEAYGVMEYLLSSHLEVINDDIRYYDTNNCLTISSLEAGIKLSFNINENNIKSNGELNLTNKVEDIVNDPSITYVNLNELVNELSSLVLGLKDSPMTVEDIYDEVVSLMDYQAYTIEGTYTYKNAYEVGVSIDVSKDLRVYGEVNIVKGEDKLSLQIYYVDEVLYLIYGNTKVKLLKEDSKDSLDLLLNILSKKEIISLDDEITSSDYQNILDTVVEVITSFTFSSSNQIQVGLALSKAFNGLDNITLDIGWNKLTGEVSFFVPEYEGQGYIKEFNGEISVPNATYLDREDLSFILDSISDIKKMTIEDKQYTLNINNLSLNIDETSYLVVGNLTQNGDDLALNLVLVYQTDKTLKLDVTKVNDIYYIDIQDKDSETIHLKGEEKSFMKIVSTFISNKDKFLGDMSLEEYYDKYLASYFGERNSFTFEDILSLGFKSLLYVYQGELTLEDNKASITYEGFNVNFYKENSSYILRMNNSTIEKLILDGEINLTRAETLINVPTFEYYEINESLINLDDILLSCIEGGWSLDDIATFTKDVLAYEGVKVNITTIEQAGFKVSGEILVDSSSNVSLDMKVEYGENETEFSLYYYQNDFYLVWNSYKLYLEHDDILDTLRVIMDFAGMGEMSLNGVYDIVDKVNQIYVSTTAVKDQKLSVTLALSRIYSELSDSTIDITYNDYFTLTSKDTGLNVTISNYLESANVPSFSHGDSDIYTRDDFDVLLDYARGFKEYLDAGELSISFEDTSHPLTINLGENKDLIVHGSVNLKTIKYTDGRDDKITFSAKLYLTGCMHYYFALEYNEAENLYITFSTNWKDNYGDLITKTSVSLTRAQVVSLLKQILTGIDENSEIGKRLSATDLNNINIAKKLFVDTGILDGKDIEVGKIDSSLQGIVPVVFKVLDFIKSATIRPNVVDRSIHVEKDYDYVTKDGEVINTSTNITLYEVEGDSTQYVCSINSLKLENYIISGNITIKKFESEVYVDKSNVMALKGIEDLASAFFNSVEQMTFNIAGQLKMKILGLYSIDVNVEARVAYLDGVIKGYIYLDVPDVLVVNHPYAITNYIHTYIYIDDNDVFMYRETKYWSWGTKYEKSYRKNTYKGFMKNIVDNIQFIMYLSDTIMKEIKNSDSEFEVVPDRLLSSYSYSDNTYSMTIDMPNGLSTDMFKSLKLNLTTSKYNDKLYLRSFSGNTTMLSIFDISFNFNENGCFGSLPDMSVYPRNIAYDSKYSYYKE